MDRLTADHSVPTSPVSALMLTFLSSLGGVFQPSSLAGASVLPGFWKHGQQQLFLDMESQKLMGFRLTSTHSLRHPKEKSWKDPVMAPSPVLSCSSINSLCPLVHE